MSDFALQAADLSKNYGKNAAIRSFTIDIPYGGLIGLIGRNGSGKTTFMKLCAGLLDLSGGKLEVFGRAPMDNLAVLSDLVYTCHNMSHEKQLRLQAILGNYAIIFKDFDREFAEKLLQYFDLKPKMRYKQLSQGMASIFNFICALACRSKLTMFDEPVLGMDVTVRKAAYEVLLRDYTEYPRTVIISSHLLAEMEGILSDILLIDEGRPVLFGNIDDLRQSSYRIEGEKAAVDSFSAGKQIIYYKNGISCEAVIKETLDDEIRTRAGQSGLRVCHVRPEDLCIYLTRENKEGELECLWQKAN
ncbi:MAG: ABC transporter ATP-binding protein [Clostridiales bacterium]|nr:ABC transporter ATP-binding protein [Clostridiales bacterium]